MFYFLPFIVEGTMILQAAETSLAERGTSGEGSAGRGGGVLGGGLKFFLEKTANVSSLGYG